MLLSINTFIYVQGVLNQLHSILKHRSNLYSWCFMMKIHYIEELKTLNKSIILQLYINLTRCDHFILIT